MKIYLIGYPGSKHILPASSFLIGKYIPNDFEVNFLNFGDYDSSKLFAGNYVKLDEEQVGGSSAWARYLTQYFEGLDDEYIIFSLDDFFLSRKIDMKVYDILLEKIKNDSTIACAKLGISPCYRPSEYDLTETMGDTKLFYLKQNAPYSVTTQYCIWRRESLIDVLEKVTDAWSFEISGSNYFNNTGQKVIGSTTVCLPYCESSAVSNRHPNKVSISGISECVIEDMITKNILNEPELIVGQPIGEVGYYSDYKNSTRDALDVITDGHYRHFCNLVHDLVKNNKYEEICCE